MELDNHNRYLVLVHPEWRGEFTFPPNFEVNFISVGHASILDSLWVFNIARRFNAGIYFSTSFITPLFTGTRKRIATLMDLINITSPEYFSGKNLIYSLVARKYLHLRTWLTVKLSDHLLTISKFSKEHIVNYFELNANSVEIVYCGVNSIFSPRPMSEETRVRYGINHPYIMGLGNFRGYKNIRTLLQAFSILKDEGRDEILILCGKYRLRLAEKIITETLLKELKNNVKFVNDLDDNRLREFYSSASVFVFPSLSEGFGIPPLEAMACGCSVVASSAASLPEVCGDAAIYADPRSSLAFADAILEVITQPELQASLQERGFCQASKFRWEESARQLIKILCSIESEPGSKE
jgi:glycosyltransferase involved in cell wall biosynthesis